VTTVPHLAYAVGSTSSSAPAYRVEMRVGKHALVADEPSALGGGDVGPSPLGLLAGALVACTATTLRMYAARKGWDLAAVAVDVRYRRAEDGSGVIDREITLPADLPADQRDRLAEVAGRTPVTLAIGTNTPITTTLRAGV
jgi:putative redox protein